MEMKMNDDLKVVIRKVHDYSGRDFLGPPLDLSGPPGAVGQRATTGERECQSLVGKLPRDITKVWGSGPKGPGNTVQRPACLVWSLGFFGVE